MAHQLDDHLAGEPASLRAVVDRGCHQIREQFLHFTVIVGENADHVTSCFDAHTHTPASVSRNPGPTKRSYPGACAPRSLIWSACIARTALDLATAPRVGRKESSRSSPSRWEYTLRGWV